MSDPAADVPAKPKPLGRWIGLALLMLVAVGLRAWGLNWGLPSAARYYPYHPDETVLLNAVCSVNPLWGDFTPGFYNYGSLYILLTRIVFDFAAPIAGWGSVPRQEPFSQWVGDFAHLLVLGRWVTVALGAATVPVTFGLGRRLFGERAGWIAAVFSAIAPGLVVFGHYMTVDVPSAFFSSLALLAAAVALEKARAEKIRPAMIWIAAAGVAAGLAAGTKYNAGLALLPVLVPVWALWKSERRGIAVAGLVLSGLAAGAAFLLSTPGVLLETPRFVHDFGVELSRNASGQGMIFQGTMPGALYHLWITLPISLEWPLYLLSLAGVVVSLRRRRPEDALLWLFILPTFLTLAGAERKFVRYAVPLIPPLCVLAARAVDEGLQTRLSGAWKAAGGVAGLGAIAASTACLGVLSGTDSRDLAADYLRSHAAAADVVALSSDPWPLWTPPVDPTAACKQGQYLGGPPIWEENKAHDAPPTPFQLSAGFRVLAPRPNTGALAVPLLNQYRPRYVVMADYEWEDPERLRRAVPHFQSGLLDLKAALTDYHVAADFRPRPSLLGFTWWSRGIPPHDWRYYMPELRVYERNADAAH
jgi:4-amino-4-deoxy-L-arabinose transferase-like glycosyltransferase